MLRPSYAELMNVLNRETNGDNVITSRYTIVIATAKRARQLIDGDEPMIENYKKGKPVSIAVEELWESKIKVVPEGHGTVLNFIRKAESNENSEGIDINALNNVKDDFDEVEELDDIEESDMEDELYDLEDNNEKE